MNRDAAERARHSLLDFTRYTFPAYQANWHHVVLCTELDAFIRGKTRFLMVFMPAQNGKSELVSRRLPAYLLGLDPELRIAACSYGADLASAMNRDVQRIMEGERYQAIFPHTKLPGDNTRTLAGRLLRNSDMFEIIGHRGYYKSAGVGGGLTGHSADVAIIDDPVKNRAEAESQAYRDGVWDWYSSTLRQRLTSDTGRILLTMTRWHHDDLAGRLLDVEKNPDADKWRVVSFPAIAEGALHASDPRREGEALWPDRYPVQELASRRVTSGSYEWGAMYQQRPSPEGGGMVRRSWFRFYRELPADLESWMASWDMAFKDLNTSDYVVGQVWARKGANKYLVDQCRARLDFPATLIAVRGIAAKWPQAAAKLVEDKANGTAVIATLRNEVPGLIAVNPEGGKVARAAAVSPAIEAGNVWLPDPSIAPWIEDFLSECEAFPNGTHDDQVDAMTQALHRMSADRPLEMWGGGMPASDKGNGAGQHEITDEQRKEAERVVLDAIRTQGGYGFHSYGG